MATYTPNLNLKKPAGSDYVLVADLNGNMDALDGALGKLGNLSTVDKSTIVNAINEARQNSLNGPKIGENNHWYVWVPASVAYSDTGVNATGPQGKKGDTGATPEMAFVVSTGLPGTDAEVTQILGTPEFPVIYLTIPRGATGATPQLSIGTVSTGAPGTNAAASIRGTAEKPVIDMTIPRGDTGSIGTLTVNGKAPNAGGEIILEAVDVGAVYLDESGTETPGEAPGIWDELLAASQIADRIYRGRDLTQVHATEIAGYTDVWAWIKARITAQNLSKIHVGDYIPFVCTNGTTVNAQIAGIDTYYQHGDTATPHHIDFISRELWPSTVQMNPVNFNNGISADANWPWLCTNAYAYLNSLAMAVPNGTTVPVATVDVDYTAGGIYYYLPDALKAVIKQKRMLLPTRYSASGVLSSDNSWAWTNMGNLWLPSEMEIAGAAVFGGTGVSAGGYVQYPIFANNMNRVKKLGVSGGRDSWWTCSAYSGGTTTFVNVGYGGYVGSSSASYAYGVPVCFRISA